MIIEIVTPRHDWLHLGALVAAGINPAAFATLLAGVLQAGRDTVHRQQEQALRVRALLG